MKILAFLQNQWFRDPDHIREILKRRPAARQRIIAYSLFAGCKTGRILKAALGEEWCQRITWEEASPEIGSEASAVFRADTRHILDAIVRERPTVILAFGKIASNAVASLCPINLTPPATVITGPHPAARNVDALNLLRDVRAKLDMLGRPI
jgi:hypothetical protein